MTLTGVYQVTAKNLLQRIYWERASAFLNSLSGSDIVSHGPTLGDMRENIIRESLLALIPNDYQVTSGFVIDCKGGITPQIDLLVHCPGTLSPLLLTDQAALLPIELFRFGIEVKSKITKSVFDQVKTQASSLSSLWNSAFIPSPNPTANASTFLFKKPSPPFILVALSSDLSIETLKSELVDADGLQGIVVFDKCLIYRNNNIFLGTSDLERVIRFWAYMFQHCVDMRQYITFTPSQETEILENVAQHLGANGITDPHFREQVLSAIKTPSILPYLYE